MIHKELKSWQLSMDLVVVIYEVTKSLPKKETFGLINQMRRCVISVPSNISEGAGRNSIKDYLKFLHNALGSLNELETQYLICQRLKLITPNPEIEESIKQTSIILMKQITALRTKLNSVPNS